MADTTKGVASTTGKKPVILHGRLDASAYLSCITIFQITHSAEENTRYSSPSREA
jgi:hypothetical protein